MDLEVIASRSKLRLLRYLAAHDGAITGRALAQAAGVEAKRASEALAGLVNAGLVQRRRAGRAFLYSINRDSYIVDQILLPAFLHERHWLERLGQEVLSSIPNASSVILYGSWAKKTANPESDVDLLVVASSNSLDRAPGFQDTIDETRGKMSERFGRPVSLLVLRRDEVRRRLRRRDTLIREIIAQGRVLAGSSLAEVLGRG